VVIVATNHSQFEGPRALREIVARVSDECLLVDPWNALGTGQVFAYACEVPVVIGSGALDRSAGRAR
jgi:UDP-N-acetyl-D-mannosaminuronic acid dehydrogenase